MNKFIIYAFAFLTTLTALSCSRQDPTPSIKPEDKPDREPGFTEAVPDTVTFTNAEFIYNGDDTGEALSDGWLIKLYTDMDTDAAGDLTGPGYVTQLLLNAPYNELQNPDPEYLPGIYSEMFNSGNFSPGTFVSGYVNYIDLPGGRIEMPEATFYASLADGSAEMNYDLIDEGAFRITSEGNGTYSIDGILVGKKYTKRYFKWNGSIEARHNVPQTTPNSTLRQDIIDPVFTKASLQDKGDSFYLKDESYRCLLLYLGEDGVEMTSSRPAGNGAVLRLEVLVPWKTDISTGTIPEGTYSMISRNPDTSIDRDKILPGAAIPGLPDVFAAWKLSGSWYYELKDGEWTDIYARIDKGNITIEKDNDGRQKVIYELYDCQNRPKKIKGETILN